MTSLILSEEQELLKDSASGFVQDASDLRRLRSARRDLQRDPADSQIWQSIVDLS